MAVCPHCNAEIDANGRFCGACGKAATVTESSPGAPSPFANADPYAAMIGREVAGRYRITEKLGEGGMGAVFRAEQTSLKRACAVKLLRPGLMANEQALRRFNAEAQAVAKLSHPNTIDIYDFGQDTDGSLFIAMEFVDGKSLRDVISAEGPLQLGRALAIASQIASSLSDAHANNVIHRDLKPDNVMLSTRGKQKDVVHVLDFGIAKLRDDAAGKQGGAAMTQAGDMLGTPQYMAPEQIRGETIDGRADVYALGCILYEMVTGRMPHEANSVLAMLTKHLQEEVEPPSKRRPDLRITPAVDALISTALQKDANARAATMEIFGEQITAVFSHLPPELRGGATANTSGGIAVPVPTPSAAQPVPAMALGATALVNAPPPFTPFGQQAPVPAQAAPTPYGKSPLPAFVPMMPPQTAPKPAAAGGNVGMIVTIGIVVAALIGLFVWVEMSDKGIDPNDPNFLRIDPPKGPSTHHDDWDVKPGEESEEARKMREDIDKKIEKAMDDIEKAQDKAEDDKP